MASQSPPPLPADAEVVRNIEVLAAFVAKTGAHFEQLARVNTAGDPKFGFLLGDSPPGSEAARSHAFYEWKKQRLEQGVFAIDGSDDIQLKICAMVDDARTPSKVPLFEPHARDEMELTPPGASERTSSEALTAAVRTAESSQSNKSIMAPDRAPLLRANGDMKPPKSTAPTMRKAELITADNMMKKVMPEKVQTGRPLLFLQGTKDPHIIGDSQRRKPVIADCAHKAGNKEDSRSSSGCPSDEVRASAGDVRVDKQSAEAAEKHSKESHGWRLLKSALADYVKEALKPAWKEGNMSKEAFKAIVKKVVDKVTGSLQAHQIPKSQENVDQYMTQSEAKISKLVQVQEELMVKPGSTIGGLIVAA